MNKAAEADSIGKVKRGEPVAGAWILERRTKGLAAIRRDCLAQLSRRAGLPADSSKIVRWRGLGDRSNARSVTLASFDLVLHSGANPVGKRDVEAVIGRMCEEAVAGPGG